MTIHELEITDLQADALAKAFRISAYTDVDDLLTQCITVAYLKATKQWLVSAIMNQTDITVLDTTTTALNTAIATPVVVAPPLE